MTLEAHRRDWQDLAELDPRWAILSAADKQHGGWDLEEFLETGRKEIDALMGHVERLGLPRQRRRALDFGCGVGRLSRALAAHFAEAVGVDIAEGMVEQARVTNADVPGCRFVVNVDDRLPAFADDEFDLIYTTLVLQHLPSRVLVASYLREFVRVLAPGGVLVFQLPARIPWRHRLQIRRRAYRLLRAVGVAPETLYKRMDLQPMRYNAVDQDEVRAIVEGAGGQVLEVGVERWVDGVTSASYYVAC